ncbi:hypothetical protein FIBSPDRAFT_902112 [Athelia psychrophila]|uniref:Uncharacterized protein n=1 Tax=Athelia psychrophila TaxID=1759441 RepID=A0A167XMJ7_9AGAM|nr:hypothetical protein FIBSPDRAFT_902112 [Fibularhizoctonia sp. CBS 109695]
MGFDTNMASLPMIIIWPSSDMNVTLSQRSYPQALPPARPPPTQSSSPEPIAPPLALIELQAQLHDTQSSLASHTGSLKDEGVEDFAGGDDDARNICTLVPHELELVAEEDEEHAAQHEATKTAATLGLSTSPTTAHRRPKHHLYPRVKINALESLVQTTQQAPPVVEAPPLPAPTSAQPDNKSLTDIPAKWEKTDDGQWSSVREEWATERERLIHKRKVEVKGLPKPSLGNTTAQFDAGLATMAPLQRQQGAASSLGSGGGGSKGFRGGLATAPSPRSLSADSDRPRHRRKRNTLSTRGRLRSSSREAQAMGADDHDEVIRLYTPSLSDDSSDPELFRQE